MRNLGTAHCLVRLYKLVYHDLLEKFIERIILCVLFFLVVLVDLDIYHTVFSHFHNRFVSLFL